TQRIVIQVDQAPSVGDRREVVEKIARIAVIRITVAFQDSVLWDAKAARFASGRLLYADPPLETTLIDEDSYVTHPDADGQPVYYVTQRLPQTGLVIRIGQSAPPLLDLVRRMRTTLVIGMVMALFLSLLGSWIAAQRVTWPLQTIRNSARAISEGNFNQDIVVDSRATEFQDLAESLNRMSDSFRDKITNLEKMSQVQNEFIGNVSHEVRNPIFAVGGYLEALATTNLSEDQRQRYAEKALTNLQRLSTLFNDLIEIARLGYREDLLQREMFSLTELVHDVAETLRPKAADKGLELIADNPEMVVVADRNRIRQVIINLSENAVAYCDHGSVEISLSKQGKKVNCAIRDTGKGMAPEHLERIFDRFYRVEPDRARKTGGTGLGLSIVKQILQAHGEQIRVQSVEGEGTTFTFQLPLVEIAQPETV
ncbi:MAG: HAMP domain-containing histidine kinase, partial [Bacteroidetes bacterium]|nr:HAMP domain-containing histidine kinase [Bacteroidota bacterium]